MEQLFNLFDEQPNEKELPKRFPSPFANTPADIVKKAAQQLQKELEASNSWRHDFNAVGGGKMFGVLVVKNKKNEFGYLAGFSGKLAGQWNIRGFVPPVFNLQLHRHIQVEGQVQQDELDVQILEIEANPAFRVLKQSMTSILRHYETDVEEIKALNADRKAKRQLHRQKSRMLSDEMARQLNTELNQESRDDRYHLKQVREEWLVKIKETQSQLDQFEKEIKKLKKLQRAKCKKTEAQLFDLYRLWNDLGEEISIRDLWVNQLPPAGAGDCAGIKLMQYAYSNHLAPVALTEFWWGASPENEIRHHGQYYPSCRSKCYPILPYMMKGLDAEASPWEKQNHLSQLNYEKVFEDDYLLLVNKPAGLLSVPGGKVEDSVYARIRAEYPKAEGPLLVHRLDMSTSGLLLIAKDCRTHNKLQKQFVERTIKKRYLAILSRALEFTKGEIALPLRVDIDDRPRQLVCYDQGKQAKTLWELVRIFDNRSLVNFYPITGRTHQLRLHAAHKKGLDAPIVGDELYGTPGKRLMLQAQYLEFTHPNSGKRMQFELEADFDL